MAVFISDYLNLCTALTDCGVFDSLLDRDSNYFNCFINVVRLRNASTPEFSNSYSSICEYSSKIALLLNASNNQSDRMYREAVNRFDFSEVNGINLGFSETQYGAGFGDRLGEQVIRDAYGYCQEWIE